MLGLLGLKTNQHHSQHICHPFDHDTQRGMPSNEFRSDRQTSGWSRRLKQDQAEETTLATFTMLLHHHLSIIIYHLYHLYYTMFNYILYYTLCKRTRQGRPLRCSQTHFIIIGCHSFHGLYWFSPCHLIITVNIVITTIYWLGLLDLINERGERQTQV